MDKNFIHVEIPFLPETCEICGDVETPESPLVLHEDTDKYYCEDCYINKFQAMDAPNDIIS